MLTRDMLQGKLLTVLGVISPRDAGTVFPHEHILINHSRPDVWLDDTEIAVEELKRLRLQPTQALLKNKTVVDLSGIGIRPDGYFQKLYDIACELKYDATCNSAVHIIACTGFYKSNAGDPANPWAYPYIVDQTADQLCQLMTREILGGTTVEGEDGPVDVHAGVIKVGISGNNELLEQIDPLELKVIDAAILAHHETGAPLVFHFDSGGWRAQSGNISLRFSVVDYLLENGVPANKIILSHGWIQRFAREYNEQMASRKVYVCADFGSFVERVDDDHISQNDIDAYKTVGQELYHLLNESICRDSIIKQLLFSHDVCYKHMLWRNGGGGYAHLMEHVYGPIWCNSCGIDGASQILPITQDNSQNAMAFV